jgi:hypothetical protein
MPPGPAPLAGYTVAIIAFDLLGATGGPNANQAFMFAIMRATEICVGIVSASIVLAGTDFGGAERRLATSFAALASEIASRFTDSLGRVGAKLRETQPIRRELVKQVIALDPIIDEAIGESSQLRVHSPVLQAAVDGLFDALAGWRAVAEHLLGLPDPEARKQAGAVLKDVPGELLATGQHGESADWLREPVRLRRSCEVSARLEGTLLAREGTRVEPRDGPAGPRDAMRERPRRASALPKESS